MTGARRCGPLARRWVCLLEGNDAGRVHLERAGFRGTGTFPRMVWGEPVAWHPDAIWGLFSGGLG